MHTQEYFVKFISLSGFTNHSEKIFKIYTYYICVYILFSYIVKVSIYLRLNFSEICEDVFSDV